MSGWLLAVETSTARGGLALWRDGEPRRRLALEPGLRHGTRLVPAMDELLREEGLRPEALAFVAVSAGPGSYTGTRVGVMAAKAVAFAGGARLALVSSLAALAWSLRGEARRLLAVRDSRRDEVYAGLYDLADGRLRVEREAALTPPEAARLAADAGEPVPAVAGEALATYGRVFAEALPAGALRLAEPEAVRVADAVAALGWRACAGPDGGGPDAGAAPSDPFRAQPRYFRRDDGGGWRKDAAVAPA